MPHPSDTDYGSFERSCKGTTGNPVRQPVPTVGPRWHQPGVESNQDGMGKPESVKVILQSGRGTRQSLALHRHWPSPQQSVGQHSPRFPSWTKSAPWMAPLEREHDADAGESMKNQVFKKMDP